MSLQKKGKLPMVCNRCCAVIVSGRGHKEHCDRHYASRRPAAAADPGQPEKPAADPRALQPDNQGAAAICRSCGKPAFGQMHTALQIKPLPEKPAAEDPLQLPDNQAEKPRPWLVTLQTAIYCGANHPMFGVEGRLFLWTCRAEGCRYQGKLFRVSWPQIDAQEVRP